MYLNLVLFTLRKLGHYMKSFGSIITTMGLDTIQSSCFIPSEFHIELAIPQERVHNPLAGRMGVYEEAIKIGLYFPLHPFVVKLLDRYALSLAQTAPNSWHYIIGFLSLCSLYGRRLTVSLFRACFSLKRHSWDHKWWYFSSRSNRKLVSDIPSSIHRWKELFVFIFVEQPWRFDAT